MTGLRILDLYCGAGGAAMGYARAGFEVVGIDINPQPYFPFDFVLGDCLDLDPADLAADFDAVHASPPCQAYSQKRASWGRPRKHPVEHADLMPQTRRFLQATGLPYIIENVKGAPLRGDMMLCGSMFGLAIRKHRYFETSFPCFALMPPCDHRRIYDPWHGKGRTADAMREAQGTPWIPMCGGKTRRQGTSGDLFNAIPPAFTEWLGGRLMAHLQEAAAA